MKLMLILFLLVTTELRLILFLLVTTELRLILFLLVTTELRLILFLLVTIELRLIYTMDLNKFIVWKYLLLYLKHYCYGKFATVVPLL